MNIAQYAELGAAIASAQAQDQKGSIPYRPQYNHITGKVTASILLQQISYWWFISEQKPFYKFRAPCDHELCRKGDSWTEELGMTIYEFDGALKRIGAKVTKGTSKKDLLKKNLVIYWTDTNRVTWYQVNEELLFGAIYLAYNEPDLLGKLTFPTQLRKREKSTFIPTETTSETNKQHVASDATDEKPQQQSVTTVTKKPELTGNALLDSFEIKRAPTTNATKTPHWRERASTPATGWGGGSEEFQRQLVRYGGDGLDVQELGFELEAALGLRPDWKRPKKVKSWSAGLAECLEIAEDSIPFVLEAARKMREDGLTIANPYSLHKTIAARMAERRTPTPVPRAVEVVR